MQLYEDIEDCIHNQQSLTMAITDLHSHLMPKRYFIANGLTNQQSLSIVYEHLRAPLNKLCQEISALAGN
jgi:hypothetical protein